MESDSRGEGGRPYTRIEWHEAFAAEEIAGTQVQCVDKIVARIRAGLPGVQGDGGRFTGICHRHCDGPLARVQPHTRARG